MRGMAVNEAPRFQNIGEFQKALLKEKKVVDDKTELKKRKKTCVYDGGCGSFAGSRRVRGMAYL